jgi:hypothetical protein
MRLLPHQERMSFSIFITAPYIDITAFYPYPGWDEDYEGWRDNEEDVALREFIEKCIAVDPEKGNEVEDLWDVVVDPAYEYLSGVGVAVSGCDASIEVDDEEIDNPFADYGKYDVPELEVLIPEIINSKFCFVKIWENSGGWFYKGNGEFDLSKLTWEKGRFAYDGEEIDFTDGDGSSSYTCFYKDGRIVG